MTPQDRTHTVKPYPLRSRGGKGAGETFARLLAKPKRLDRSTRINSLKMKIHFDHERLQAYPSSLQFVRGTEPVIEKLPKTGAAYLQLEGTAHPLSE
jgi:hypothetical protein